MISAGTNPTYQEKFPYIEGEIYTSKSPQSPDSVTRLVQIVDTKIKFLILKLKYITIESLNVVNTKPYYF